MMHDYDELIGRAKDLLQELAQAIQFSDGNLRFTVNGGWLVKIEELVRFRFCRPAKRHAIWIRPTSGSGAEFDKIHELISDELVAVITALTGKYGALEVEFSDFEMISFMIKMAFRCARRHAVGR